MSIQPGVGYTFNSSSLGTNLDIEKPWSEWDSSALTTYQQFQVRSIVVGITNKLQIAKGTVSFTQSNMPRVKFGGHYDQRQSWISKIAVYGSGVSRTAGTASSTDIWMEAGGYYNITSAGLYYVTISKFDINQSNDDTTSALLNAEQPWVSIFKSGDSIEDTIFSETGPSEYANTTNIHKMTGYDAASIGGTKDWGNCHTTYFNPIKWGYSVKLIATVNAVSTAGGLVFTVDQHIVGPIDLQIPCLFNGTTLTNRDDLNEVNDPYNTNRLSEPRWPNIANATTKTAMEGLTAANEDWFQEFVGPADWTEKNFDYRTEGSCAAQDDGDGCLHPFQMKPRELTVASPEGPVILYRANICAGTVNNLIPWNMPGPSRVKLPTSIDFGYGGPGVSECKVFLRVGTQGHDTDNPIFPVTDDESELYPTIVQYYEDQYPDIPADDDIFCYILMGVARNIGNPETFTIDQTISGSVWAERLKIGDNTARYYWAGV
jgi:hypothetical protein